MAPARITSIAVFIEALAVMTMIAASKSSPQGLQHVEAGAVRQFEVEQDGVRIPGAGMFQRRGGGLGHADGVVQVAQMRLATSAWVGVSSTSRMSNT